MSPVTPSLAGGKATDLRTVTLAASVGSIAEYFDWGVAAPIAALVWPTIFFPGLNPAEAVAASLATFGVVYLTRPLGAYVFGRFGDKNGRKKGLTWTLVLMGMGSFGLSLAPGYATIGATAPILLILLRVAQGLGHGGEWGGASTWVSESAAESKRRSFWTGWVTFAAPAGNLLASLSFFWLSSTMPRADFFSYGWRLLFVSGAAVALAGLLIRWRFTESPMFARKEELRQPELRDPGFLRSEWKRVTVLTLSFMCLSLTVGVLTSTFALNYLTKLGASPSGATLYAWIARVPGLFAFVAGAFIGDFKGRLLTLRVGTLALIPSVLLFFPLVNINSFLPILVAFILIEVPVNFASGSVAALFTESFPTRHRNRGAGMSYHTGALVHGLVLTLLLPAIISYSGGVLNSALPVAFMLVSFVAVSLLASFKVSETRTLMVADRRLESMIGPPGIARTNHGKD
ncbi:MAG: MFS transporter [Thaumarchaeota archaeon]|nr:MFS transporter [Nitrososphaerota archaeon]